MAVMIICVPCRNSGRTSGADEKSVAADTVTVAISPSVPPVTDYSEENSNPFFTPYPVPEGMIEANSAFMPNRMTSTVSLGEGMGDVTLVLEKTDNGIIPWVAYLGKEYKLLDSGDEPCIMASLAVLDLDGDGRKEVLFHDGDLFNLHIFALTGGSLNPFRLLGRLSCNYGFFITRDHRIVSRVGSQGGAVFARIEAGELVVSDECDIDKLLFSSRGFHDLVYLFDDNSAEFRHHEPLLRTRKYFICHTDERYGDHVMKVDLDGDGAAEDLYYGNPGWGAVSYDIIRVNRLEKSLPIAPSMQDDTIAFEVSQFDSFIKDYIQMSAVDVDGDGHDEVVVTAGTLDLNSTYVFTYTPDSLLLRKHFVKRGIVRESDLR